MAGLTAQNALDSICLDRKLVYNEALEEALRVILKDVLPTRDDLWRRQDLLQRIDSVVRRGLAGHDGQHLRVQPFGSFIIGLYSSNSDLDLTIDGTTTKTTKDGDTIMIPLFLLAKSKKVQILSALQFQLRRLGWLYGEHQVVRWARVPVFKFNDAETGLPCDVSISNRDGEFKSRLLGMVLEMDERALALALLVKLWAKRQGVNDPAGGTFNSYALTLLVIFYLQTLPQPLLPSLADVLSLPPSAVQERPLHNGRPPTSLPPLADVSAKISTICRERGYHGGRAPSLLTLGELLIDFFHMFRSLVDLWDRDESVRACPFSAELRRQGWGKKPYVMAVEDPFDCMDNTMRTVHPKSVAHIRRAVADACNATHSGDLKVCMVTLFVGAAGEHMSRAVYNEALATRRQDTRQVLGLHPVVDPFWPRPPAAHMHPPTPLDQDNRRWLCPDPLHTESDDEFFRQFEQEGWSLDHKEPSVDDSGSASNGGGGGSGARDGSGGGATGGGGGHAERSRGSWGDGLGTSGAGQQQPDDEWFDQEGVVLFGSFDEPSVDSGGGGGSGGVSRAGRPRGSRRSRRGAIGAGQQQPQQQGSLSSGMHYGAVDHHGGAVLSGGSGLDAGVGPSSSAQAGAGPHVGRGEGRQAGRQAGQMDASERTDAAAPGRRRAPRNKHPGKRPGAGGGAAPTNSGIGGGGGPMAGHVQQQQLTEGLANLDIAGRRQQPVGHRQQQQPVHFVHCTRLADDGQRQPTALTGSAVSGEGGAPVGGRGEKPRRPRRGGRSRSNRAAQVTQAAA